MMLAALHFTSKIEVLFGVKSTENFALNLDYVWLLAKKYIHDCKMTSRSIIFLSFLVLLRQELYYEELICIINQYEQDFIDKWGRLYDQF